MILWKWSLTLSGHTPSKTVMGTVAAPPREVPAQSCVWFGGFRGPKKSIMLPGLNTLALRIFFLK